MPFEDEEAGDEWKWKPLREAAIPLKQSAREIYKITDALIEAVPEDNEHLQDYKSWMMENALKIEVKISGAMATGDYILMMENATIIKLCARELLTQTSGLAMFDYDDRDYINTLRSEIEKFKRLFVKWVRAIPREEPLWPDGWGLFYTENDVAKWNSLNPDEQVEE